jgi:hypothetical protein
MSVPINPTDCHACGLPGARVGDYYTTDDDGTERPLYECAACEWVRQAQDMLDLARHQLPVRPLRSDDVRTMRLRIQDAAAALAEADRLLRDVQAHDEEHGATWARREEAAE